MIGNIPSGSTVADELRRMCLWIKFYSHMSREEAASRKEASFKEDMFPVVKLLINLWMKLLKTQSHEALVHVCFPDVVEKLNMFKQTAEGGGFEAFQAVLHDTIDDMKNALVSC